MRYLTSDQIYTYEVLFAFKRLPSLPKEEEHLFQIHCLTVTELARVLNLYPTWRQFFMFDERAQYKQSKQKIQEILSFYAIDLNISSKYLLSYSRGSA